MTVPAIQSQPRRVMLVAEWDRLFRGDPGAGYISRAVDLGGDESQGEQDKQRAKNR